MVCTHVLQHVITKDSMTMPTSPLCAFRLHNKQVGLCRMLLKQGQACKGPLQIDSNILAWYSRQEGRAKRRVSTCSSRVGWLCAAGWL